MTSPTPTGVLTPEEQAVVTDWREAVRQYPNSSLAAKSVVKLVAIIDRLTASAEQVRREAWNAAIEEAATRCDLCAENGRKDRWSASWIDSAMNCAVQIRALIKTPSKEGEDK